MTTTAPTAAVTVEGVRLDTLAFNIETFSGRIAMSGKRGENIVIPGRHGKLWRPKRLDSTPYTLKMWVRGCNEDGEFLTSFANHMAQYRQNVDYLWSIFGTLHKELEVIEQWPPSGSTRRAYMEVVQTIDPESLGPRPGSRFNVAMDNLSGMWESVNEADFTSPPVVDAGTSFTVTTLSGSTAPNLEAILVVRGPATNPKLIDVATGHWIMYSGVLSTTQHWRIDLKAAASRAGTNIGYTLAGSNVLATTSFSGHHSPNMFGITPGPLTGSPVLRYEATGTTNNNTRVDVRARKKFL
jgi:hypothetical protein